MPYKNKLKALEANRNWRKNNPDKVKAQIKRYRLKNIDRVRAYGRKYSKEYRKKNPEKVKEYNIKYNKPYRESHKEELKEYQKQYILKNRELLKLKQSDYRERNRIKIRIGKIKNKFHISFEEAEKLYKKAHTICDICKQPEKSKGQILSIDHDHDTDKIRGILCSRCNISLGGFKNSIKNLKQAIKYLLQKSKKYEL